MKLTNEVINEIRKNDKLITYLRENPKRGVEYINKKSM